MDDTKQIHAQWLLEKIVELPVGTLLSLRIAGAQRLGLRHDFTDGRGVMFAGQIDTATYTEADALVELLDDAKQADGTYRFVSVQQAPQSESLFAESTGPENVTHTHREANRSDARDAMTHLINERCVPVLAGVTHDAFASVLAVHRQADGAMAATTCGAEVLEKWLDPGYRARMTAWAHQHPAYIPDWLGRTFNNRDLARAVISPGDPDVELKSLAQVPGQWYRYDPERTTAA